jgi:hypothetical protein
LPSTIRLRLSVRSKGNASRRLAGWSERLITVVIYVPPMRTLQCQALQYWLGCEAGALLTTRMAPKHTVLVCTGGRSLCQALWRCVDVWLPQTLSYHTTSCVAIESVRATGSEQPWNRSPPSCARADRPARAGDTMRAETSRDLV